MITKEVRMWIKKVEQRQYTYSDAIYTLNSFAPYLTKEELVFLKNKIKEMGY